MPPSTKIRRGVGLLLLGVLGMTLGGALLAVLSDDVGQVVVVAFLLLVWVALFAAAAGLVLLLWGLLRG